MIHSQWNKYRIRMHWCPSKVNDVTLCVMYAVKIRCMCCNTGSWLIYVQIYPWQWNNHFVFILTTNKILRQNYFYFRLLDLETCVKFNRLIYRKQITVLSKQPRFSVSEKTYLISCNIIFQRHISRTQWFQVKIKI